MALPIVEPSGCVIGVDIAQPMLEVARSRLNGSAFDAVAADGQALPFDDRSFDAIVCQLGLQFFSDPARGLQECHRVLRNDRCVAVCVIGSPDRAPMWGILADALSRFLPNQRDTLFLSFALADPERLATLLHSAGFRDVAIERETRQGIVESFDSYWAHVEAGAGTLPQAYWALSEAHRLLVREEVRARLAEFQSGEKLVLSVEMLIGSGRA
jgi:SAM-dependent methyltransferase